MYVYILSIYIYFQVHKKMAGNNRRNQAEDPRASSLLILLKHA